MCAKIVPQNIGKKVSQQKGGKLYRYTTYIKQHEPLWDDSGWLWFIKYILRLTKSKKKFKNFKKTIKAKKHTKLAFFLTKSLLGKNLQINWYT